MVVDAVREGALLALAVGLDESGAGAVGCGVCGTGWLVAGGRGWDRWCTATAVAVMATAATAAATTKGAPARRT